MPDVWYHFAVDKDASGKIRLYVNGVMVGSSTPLNSASMVTTSVDNWISATIGLFGTNRLDGQH